MKISVLDKALMGQDLDFSRLFSFGEVEIYENTAPDELLSHIGEAEVIILNKVKITAEAITASSLKLICVFATGYDNIDLKAAREKGVAVCNVPGYSTNSVLLFTMATALALYSRIFEYNAFVRSGEYSASGRANSLIPVFRELYGKKWGIIGCGNIGRAVAAAASALGAEVIVNKRTPSAEFKCVDIDTLCRESDVITIHCPLTDMTRGLINKERIALMKREVVIVNEARGAVVCERDIADAVIEGRIGGFGSDVYSVEPFGESHPFYEIKERENVILTPHAAWASLDSRERCLTVICDNITSFVRGERLNRVD